MHRKYAIIDLETTGGMAKRDKITEVAIIIHDGTRVIDSFQSLVNPERAIPPHITRITGITNEMVADAPRFYEIAKTVIEITEGCIFVAHNVRFDYSFLTEEFKSLGYTYTRRQLCTVRLCRKAFPGLRSYSLGNLIKHFDIEVVNRHRAYDDAYATSILLEKIFKVQDANAKELKRFVSDGIRNTKLPGRLSHEDLEQLPSACGVYYFLDKDKNIAYIGKSINIFKRVKQHFSKNSRKADKLFQSVHHIDFELTGSELVSLILESYEIKRHQPPINKIQKTRAFNYAVVREMDKSGYMFYKVKQRRFASDALSYYSSKRAALSHIEQIGESFQLCHKVNGLEKRKEACFNHSISKCLGACIGQEPVHAYNERFMESMECLNRQFTDNFFIIDEGRSIEEHAVVLVEDGHFAGYGYMPQGTAAMEPGELKTHIDKKEFNPEVDLIIRNYIWSKPDLKLIYI